MRLELLLISDGGVIGSLFVALTRYDTSFPIRFKVFNVLDFTNEICRDIVDRPSLIILDISNESQKESVLSCLNDISFVDIPIVHTQSEVDGLSETRLIELLHKSKSSAEDRIYAGVDNKEMILIPAGNYKRRRGISPDYSSGGSEQQVVTRTGAFYIDKYPVTNAEYDCFLKSTGYTSPSYWKNGEYPQNKCNHPVCGVNWDDVMAYAKWANKRIPTPDEWEKAAFGEDGTNFPWGKNFDPMKCNVAASNIGGTTQVDKYDFANDEHHSENSISIQKTKRGTSHYGVSDLIGNVWEWVYVWTATSDNRMLMGGAWDTDEKLLQEPVFAHVHANAKLRGGNFGFRLVISLNSYLME